MQWQTSGYATIKNRNFTFCSPRGLSVTDYLLTHKFNSDSLNIFQILDFNNFSDHTHIYFTFPGKPTAKQTISSAGEFEQNGFNEEKNADYEDRLRQNLFSFDVSLIQILTLIKKLTLSQKFYMIMQIKVLVKYPC